MLTIVVSLVVTLHLQTTLQRSSTNLQETTSVHASSVSSLQETMRGITYTSPTLQAVSTVHQSSVPTEDGLCSGRQVPVSISTTILPSRITRYSQLSSSEDLTVLQVRQTSHSILLVTFISSRLVTGSLQDMECTSHRWVTRTSSGREHISSTSVSSSVSGETESSSRLQSITQRLWTLSQTSHFLHRLVLLHTRRIWVW